MKEPRHLPRFDLLVRAGRVACPMLGLSQSGSVAICGDRIAAVGPEVEGECRQSIEDPEAILLPGLIDLHAHPGRSGSQFGIEPDRNLLAHGTTTVLSQGDAGAGNCGAYLREVIESSATDIRLAINLSSRGEIGPGGCFERLEWADVSACIAAIERYRRHIWGIAVNVSCASCGRTDPREVLRRGLTAAEATGLPLLFGMRPPEDWPLEDQLRSLRPGDVVTYCYRSTPHCIVQSGRVIPAVREARDRGILFDLGHGRGSFNFETAEAALRDGFPPDTISTDLQRGHLGAVPVHDLPLVMSKLSAAGMTESDIFRAVTFTPASVLGALQEIGTLRVGSRADLVLLHRDEIHEPLVDTHGNARAGNRWKVQKVIRAGKLVFPPESP